MENSKRRDFLKRTIATGAGALISLQTGLPVLAAPKGEKDGTAATSPVLGKAEGISERVQAEKIVLTKDGQSLELNGVGAFIWRHLNGSRSTHLLAQMMADSFGISHSCALADCRRFLDGLAEQSFVEIVKAAPCFRFPTGRGSAT